jgi:endonuclease/exonuclease/phosphatase family metal-dependent hydrolase
MHRFLFFSLILLTFACTQQQDAFTDSYNSHTIYPEWYDPSEMDTLKLLSWNVEHFIDDIDNPYIDNRRENNPPDNMDERRAMFAEVIRKVDADIVVLQEFESDSYAMKLAEEYFPELGYQVFAAHESNDWYMNVVVMSRVPLGMFYSYATTNTPIIGQTNDDGSPASQTFINNRMWTVDVLAKPDYEFSLTGVHLKAGRGERNENWRLGQINLIRSQLERLKAIEPDRNFMIAGDFNATPDSDEFAALLGAGSELEFVDPLAGTGVFSHPADSVFWRIDHIIPSSSMMPEIVGDTVQVLYPFSPDSMRMIADHLPMYIEIITTDQ